MRARQRAASTPGAWREALFDHLPTTVSFRLLYHRYSTTDIDLDVETFKEASRKGNYKQRIFIDSLNDFHGDNLMRADKKRNVINRASIVTTIGSWSLSHEVFKTNGSASNLPSSWRASKRGSWCKLCRSSRSSSGQYSNGLVAQSPHRSSKSTAEDPFA